MKDMGWVVRCLVGCFRPLISLAAREGDDQDEVLRKTLLLPAAVVVGAAYMISVVERAAQGLGPFGLIPDALSGLVCIYGVLDVILTKSLSQGKAAFLVIALNTFGGMLLGVMNYGLAENYTTVIPVMDCLLLFKCRDVYTEMLRNVMLVYIVLISIEQTVGLGIYDAIPEDWSGYKRPAPRGDEILMPLVTQRVLIFITDFAMTRYFAHQMHAEQDIIRASISMAQDITQALARFDTSTAEELISRESGLPPEMRDALAVLVKNLCSYRPYLPQSCLPDEVESANSSDEASEPHCKSLSANDSISVGTRMSALVVLPHTPRQVALLQTNLVGFLPATGKDFTVASDFITQYLTTILASARRYNGLVEAFNADRILLSFNAAKPCTSYHRRAVECAQAILQSDLPLSETRWSMAAVGGVVNCGPMGCEGLKRYTLLGTAIPWVHVVERYAKHFKLSLVLDSLVAGAIEQFFHLRMLDHVHYVKQGAPTRLWTPTGPIVFEVEEWMYQLQTCRNRWSLYNKVYESAFSRTVDPQDVAKLSEDHTPEARLLCNFVSSGLESNTSPCRVITDFGSSTSPFDSILSAGLEEVHSM